MSPVGHYVALGRVKDQGPAYYGPDEVEYHVYLVLNGVETIVSGPFPTMTLAEQESARIEQSLQDKEKPGDIVAWLRRRQHGDLVCIPGRLAGEIADHIEKLERALPK